jgi:cytochrome c556
MIMKSIGKVAALSLVALSMSSVSMAESHSEKVTDPSVKARHAQMQLIAHHTGILGGMAKGETDYDAEMAKLAAMNLNAAANLAVEPIWVAGSAHGEAVGAYAKPEVWSDQAGFVSKLDGLRKASSDMIEAAGTDLDALKAGMGALGGACKACHESYRVPKN